MINNLAINEELCGELWPFIDNDDVTDIKWNGSALWINDLKKGRYMLVDEQGTPIKLDEKRLEIFCSRVANANNVSFNFSSPSLMAETPELRIQALHPSITGDTTLTLAIRKTPAVSRLANQDLLKDGYASEMILKVLPCLMRARLSGIVTGDVGAGKTELQKYMIGFIPGKDGIFTVEDTLEMKAKILYPEKDITSIKYNDKTYTESDAIRDCLRLVNKWLILAESRGRDIKRVLEGSSTGCTALTSVHAENTWDIPDRILNMIGEEAKFNTKNDIFSFFSYAIKVSQHINENGITRNIDQLCFFVRENGKNKIVKFVVDGEWTGEKVPESILEKFNRAKELGNFDKYEQSFLNLYNKKLDEIAEVNNDEVSQIKDGANAVKKENNQSNHKKSNNLSQVKNEKKEINKTNVLVDEFFGNKKEEDDLKLNEEKQKVKETEIIKGEPIAEDKKETEKTEVDNKTDVLNPLDLFKDDFEGGGF